MITVGITGQSGFIGNYLFNTLGLYPDNFDRISFDDSYFLDIDLLRGFVRKCDVVVHLAAINRHNDPKVIYQTNITLVKQLIAACESTGSTPHIIFSSSSQEERDNMYGKSKKEGRILFEKWAAKSNASFSGLIIPNVYGPFGHPSYNSVVATFCHQLNHQETPKIDTDATLNLVYVGELTNHFIKIIEDVYKVQFEAKNSIQEIGIKSTTRLKVSRLLKILESFKEGYYSCGEIPDLNSTARLNLWNTFLCYVDLQNFFPYHLKLNTDHRGSFVETIKLKSGGQVSFSTTDPGITRGNHFHTHKAERFAVIKGKARIELRRIGTDKVHCFELNGTNPSFVDMPIWHTHNITNIGKEELYTIFWINEKFNPDDPDTYFEIV